MLLAVNSWGITPEALPDNPLPMLERFRVDLPPLNMPHPATVANLAAQPRFTKLPSKAAADAALKLYSDCEAAILEWKEKLNLACKTSLVLNSERKPARWPGTMDDFLRLIVKARDTTEGLPRFKRFLRNCLHQEQARRRLPRLSEEEEIDSVERRIKELKITPEAAFSAEWWPWVSYAYKAWWITEYHATKQRAGRARAAQAYARKQTHPKKKLLPGS